MTSDKTIILYHDDNLSRHFGINKKVSEVSFEFIKKLGRFRTHIPTLQEAL